MADHTFEAALETLNSQYADTKTFYDSFKGYFKELDNNLKDYFKKSLSQSKDNNKSEKNQFLRYAEVINDGLNRTTSEIKRSLESGKDKPADIAKTIISSILPEKTKNLSLDEKIAEQKNFGPKTNFIDFSPKSAVFLRDIVLQLSNRQEDANKRIDKYLKHSSDALDAIEGNTSNKGGIFDGLGKLLLIGGAASLLIGLFWKDKIKPWLEQTLGVKLGFFDKFNGIIESMGKFFTLGGLKLSGVDFLGKVSGTVLKSFGEFLEVTLKGIFSEGLFKIVGGAQDGKIIGKTIFGKLLPKIAGSLFKGIGTIAFRSIPVIGGIISLGFAAKDFENNDPVSGTLNLVAGLLNFLELVPGLAIITSPLSIGVSVLNGILDYKAGTGTPDQRTNKKIKILSNWGLQLFNLIKKTPLVGNIITAIEGFGDFITAIVNGNTPKAINALDMMGQFPVLGVFPSILSGILSSADLDSSGKITSFNWKTAADNIRKKISKAVISWFPFPFQPLIAKELGMNIEGEYLSDMPEMDKTTSKTIRSTQQTMDVSSKVSREIHDKQEYSPELNAYLDKNISELKEQLEILEKRSKGWVPEDEGKFNFWKVFWGADKKYDADYRMRSQIEAQENLEKIKKTLALAEKSKQNYEQAMQKNQNESSGLKKEKTDVSTKTTPKEEQHDDFKIIDSKNKTTYRAAPTDELYGIKPGGLFDKNQKMQIDVLKNVHMAIADLHKTMKENAIATVNNVNVNNGGGGVALTGGNKMPYGYNPVTAHRESTLHILEKRRATSYA